ncbi:hypothetical protein [Streptomyces sp. DSM 40750]
MAGEGVAIWLDDLSRGRITSGYLAELLATGTSFARPVHDRRGNPSPVL